MVRAGASVPGDCVSGSPKARLLLLFRPRNPIRNAAAPARPQIPGNSLFVDRAGQGADRQLIRRHAPASACPHEVENADQVSGFVDREHDEPKVANVCDPSSRHSGRRAEHRVVRVVADPGQQRYEYVECLLRKAVHLPEGAGL